MAWGQFIQFQLRLSEGTDAPHRISRRRPFDISTSLLRQAQHRQCRHAQGSARLLRLPLKGGVIAMCRRLVELRERKSVSVSGCNVDREEPADVPPVRLRSRTNHAGVNRCRSRSFVGQESAVPAERPVWPQTGPPQDDSWGNVSRVRITECCQATCHSERSRRISRLCAYPRRQKRANPICAETSPASMRVDRNVRPTFTPAFAQYRLPQRACKVQ